MKRMIMFLCPAVLACLLLLSCKPGTHTPPANTETDTREVPETQETIPEPPTQTVGTGDGESESGTTAAEPTTEPSDTASETEAYTRPSFDYSLFPLDPPDGSAYPVPTGAEVNVGDHGAAGDGVTDDTDTIRAALAVAADEVRTLYFPRGTYLLSQDIRLATDGHTLRLAFAEGAVIVTRARVTMDATVLAGNACILTAEGDGVYEGRIRNTGVDPRWFGARGDGRTDDSAAFQTALSLATCVTVSPADDGYVVGDLRTDGSIRLIGRRDGERRPVLIGKPGLTHLFCLNANGLYVENFDIHMSGTGEADVFYFDTSATGRDDIQLKNIRVQDAFCVIRDAGVVTNYVTNMLAEGVDCVACRGTAFDMKCFWGFVFLRDLTVDVSESRARHGVSADFPLIRLSNNAGCIFQRLTLVGDGSPTGGCGLLYRDDQAVWMDECSFRGLSGGCVRAENSSHLYFSDLDVQDCGKQALTVTNGTFIQLHGVRIAGTVDGAGDGISLSSCTGIQLTDCHVTGIGGDGIRLDKCVDTSLVDCTVRGVGGCGITQTKSKGTVAVSCTLTDNAGGAGNLTEGKELQP